MKSGKARLMKLMKNKIIFVADLFKENVLGGAESNNLVLIEYLQKRGYVVERATSHNCIIDKNKFYLIANFVRLSEEKKRFLSRHCKYLLIEHDHKYLVERDPSKYKDFLIPREKIVNKYFYEGAGAVVVLSKICQDIMEKNLRLDNITNIGTSLWSAEKFDFLRRVPTKKTIDYAIVKTNNPIKGMRESVKWCKDNNKEFEYIGALPEEEFLLQLGKVRSLVFMPQVLETFSRLTAEAKMVGCKMVTKKRLLGFASESHYSEAGLELQETIQQRVLLALDKFEELIKVISYPESLESELNYSGIA